VVVSHIAHPEAAVGILRADAVTANLIGDKSLLNTKRVLVGWFSPNDWSGAGGSRYGNIAFQFDFNTLWGRRRAYWVEVMPYGIPAPRILITDKPPQGVLPYNPASDDGPWWFDATTGRHYWYNDGENGPCCLEFMVERDVSVQDAERIDFVTHNRDMCAIHRMNPSRCPFTKGVVEDASSRFLALAAADVVKIPRALVSETINGRLRLGDQVKFALMHMLRRAEKNLAPFVGSVSWKDSSASALARAVLRAYGTGQDSDATQLASLFGQRRDLDRSCARVLRAVLREL
jgi:hypothetical protein